MNIEGGAETMVKIKKGNDEVIFWKAYVSKSDEVVRLIKKAVETYGSLDCAFNNAGSHRAS